MWRVPTGYSPNAREWGCCSQISLCSAHWRNHKPVLRLDQEAPAQTKAQCLIVFPSCWWENRFECSLLGRGQDFLISATWMSIVMSWFSQEAPSFLLVMLQKQKVLSHVSIQRKIAFSNLQALECLGICSSASSHPFFSWSFLLHQPVVAASSQQPYLAAVGIYLCLSLWIFKWWYISDYKANEIKQISIKAAGLEVH